MRIGILTGGGDVPGLNTVIHDVTYRARHEKNVEVVGIKRGWGGLIYMDPKSKTMDPEHALMLNEGNVRGIDRDGGTFLKSSRIFPLKVKPHQKLKEYRGIHFEGVRGMTSDVLANLDNLGIEKLIVIGGDDTLSYARHLHSVGFPVIGVPKTMDGDVAGTDYCIGFNTAISRACRSITDLRTSCGSHERIGVVELFGRHSGFTALYSAIASKADRVIIPEVPFDIRELSSLILDDKKSSPARYSILLVAEGAIPIGGREETMNGGVDAYGHAKLGGIGKRVIFGPGCLARALLHFCPKSRCFFL